jgi:hypothetical protein
VSQRWPEGERYEVFSIAPQFRVVPGVVDYGFCVLRVPAGGS